jgi:hypothetical protein
MTRYALLESALNRVWRMSVDTGSDSHSLRTIMQRMRRNPEYFSKEAISRRRSELGFDQDFTYSGLDQGLRAARSGLSAKAVAMPPSS